MGTTNFDTVEANTIIGDIQASAGSIGLAELSSGVAPSHVVKYAGQKVFAGGATTTSAVVTGVAATDIVMTSELAVTNTTGYIVGIAPTTNTLTWTFANDPGASTLSYVVFRAAA
jgi:hypothetical protein